MSSQLLLLSLLPFATAQSWTPPKATDVNNLTFVINGTGTNGIYNSSSTLAEVYGIYNYCNMPHARAREYVVPDELRYKLEYVEVIQRHHKRTPYADNEFPVEDRSWDCGDSSLFYYGEAEGVGAARIYWDIYDDPLNPLKKSGFEGDCQFPQITSGGLADSRQHGKDLFTVYAETLEFIPRQYDADKTVFRVTSNVITSQVAGALIKGMYPDIDDVPVLQQDDSIDSLLPGYSCPYANNIRAGYTGTNTNWTEHLTESDSLFKKLDDISGVDTTSSGWHSSWDHYFDNLSSRLCHGFPLPCSVANSSKCVELSDAETVFRLGQYEYTYYFRDASESLEYSATHYGLYLNELRSHILEFTSSSANSSSRPIYRHNIAHDGSLASLLGALQVAEMVWPGLGSELITEVYSGKGVESGKWFVRILWGGRVFESSALGKVDMIEAGELLTYIEGLVGERAQDVVSKCGYVATAFRNPIIPGFNPDPTIQRLGSDYFLATSSFEWFPGVPIYHSTDLIKWELIGHALNRPSQLNMRGTAPSGGIFAPTLRYRECEGRWYLVTTWFDIISPPDVTRAPRSFYVTTDNIFDETSWSDPTYVDPWGFDPDLFFDGNRTYLTTTMPSQFADPDSGYFAIWLTELDLPTGNSLTDSTLFHVSTLPLDTPRLAEGSHLFKKDEYYYLLTAEAGTEPGHREMISRARSLDGPWEENPGNPILWNGRNMSLPVLATGHADFVETEKGEWWCVFLATRPQNPRNESGAPQLGRETFLAPMEWLEGWPVVNGRMPIGEDMDGLYYLPREKIWRDEFEGELVDRGWYTPRTPYKKAWSLQERYGWLRVRGNVYSLDDRETPAGLFRKQVDLETVWSTELNFNPTSLKHEAGTTIFLSVHYHNEIALTLHPLTSARTIVTKTRSGPDATLNTTYHPVPEDGTVRLYIKATRETYFLGYFVPGEGKEEVVEWVAEVGSMWLQAHLVGWQVFTGAFWGVYASGNGLPIRGVADFAWAQTELLE
ncbi:hypothetical protein RUND412_007504 [Rhizina undulata]